MTTKQRELLNKALPDWAVKPNKRGMSAIHPMAVIDRLNEVFGHGKWGTEVEYLSSRAWVQKTQNGSRDMWSATCKLRLTIPSEGIVLEQFGGSPNDDEGDALKGAATDALTKCASYLGIGASIYKGQGNVTPTKPMTVEEACAKLSTATNLDELKTIFTGLGNLTTDNEVIAKKDELKKELNN
jgi:hypothetical protein